MGINDDTEWTGPSGEKVMLGKTSVECTANGTYTCTRKLGDASESSGTGFHTTNVEVGTSNVDIGEGVLINTTYYNNTFEYCIPPSVMNLDVALNAESDKNSITIKDLNGEGAITIFYKAKSDKNWKSVSAVAAGKKKITGLKTDTTYQVKMQTVNSAKNSAGNYVKLASPESNVIEFKTALKTKPTIKSVKISKAKYHKQYVRGYWSLAGSWTPGHWNYYTSIKVTVKLKKKVKGSVGTVFNVGGASYRVSGNKTKYTFNASVSGNAVGKKNYCKGMLLQQQRGNRNGTVFKR